MTMLEVARRAGVSQATVSRVVNGADYVSSEVVESVNRAMRELGYKPKQRRRAINSLSGGGASQAGEAAAANRESPAARSTPGVIALLMLDSTMNSHPTLALAKLRGAEQAVARAGLCLVVSSVAEDDQLPAVLQREDLVGVLLWGRRVSPRLEALLAPFPQAWLSSHADARGSRILVGNEQAGRLAAEYLVQRGVQRPAFLLPVSMNAQYEQRGNGFRSALHLAGVPAAVIAGKQVARPFEALNGPEQAAEMDHLIDELLQGNPRTDGLFVPDDLFAPLVYASLARRGVRPGADLKVVSCGNESSCLTGLHPRPATIDMGPETTGRLVVEQLLREARDPGAPDRVSLLIEPRLVPGEDLP